jgi:carotenoid cleavage dioxygenase-like enzyme
VFKAPPFFAFHYGACYVAADAATGARSLVVDMAAYDDPTIVNDLRLAPLREPRAEVSRSYYKRLTVPLGPGAPAELVRRLERGLGRVVLGGVFSALCHSDKMRMITLDQCFNETNNNNNNIITGQPLEHLTADPEANAFCEFPSINPAYYGKPYRYAYALAAARPTNVGNALSKIDVQTGATVTWHERGAFVGAFVDFGGGGDPE